MGFFKKYGRIFGIHEGRFPVLVIADLDMLKKVTVKEFNNFTNRRTLGVGDRDNPPNSQFLINLSDDAWRHNRNTLTPTFSGGKLKQMSGLICKAVDSLVKVLETKAANKEPVDIRQYTGAYTMSVIASTGFGIDLDAQGALHDSPFVTNANKFFEISIFKPIFLILLLLPCVTPLLEILKISLLPSDAVDYFRKVLSQALEERRKNPGKFNDFLELMITAEKQAQSCVVDDDDAGDTKDDTVNLNGPWVDKRKGKGLTNSEILAAAITFFSAGYETTATTLAHALYFLALNPDCQDRLVSAIDEHFPDGKSPSYETVNNLPYLEMVITETLRMIPPAGRMDRVCKRDTQINGQFIPAGITVGIPVYLIHHDPDIWPDPETFDPQRFSPENKMAHHPLQWIPFGYGPRNCIGMRLANFVIKMALVRLLQTYKFVPNSKTVPLDLGTTAFLADKKNGVWVTVEKRQ
ncbi:cytochrome P450 3A12-like isoform X2 [Liolophura sinensis]